VTAKTFGELILRRQSLAAWRLAINRQKRRIGNGNVGEAPIEEVT